MTLIEKSIIGVWSFIALFPFGFAVKILCHDPVSEEDQLIVCFLFGAMIIILIPYLIAISAFRKTIEKNFLICSFLPFMAIFLLMLFVKVSIFGIQ